MKIYSQKIYRGLGFVILTAVLVTAGSLWQSNVLKVDASVQVLVVSRTAIPFGTVFPGEETEETYTVALDTSSNLATYTTSLGQISGLLDLCPLLEIKNIDNPAEPGDDFADATLSRPSDILDKWQVSLKVPAIKGQVSQDHDGNIIVKGGDYGCKITILTRKPKTPKINFKKTAKVDKHGKVTYELTYTISGEGMLNNLVITDPLPSGTSFVSADHGGTFAAGIVTWSLGNLVSPTSGSVHVVIDPDSTTFWDAVLNYIPGVSAPRTIRVLDATTNSPVLPNLEGAAFPVLNLKDLQGRDAAFINTLFTGNFGNGIQTKIVDDAAQTFVALGDGGMITVGPSNAAGTVLTNHSGTDFTLYETPGGRDPACVSVTATDNTVYPISISSVCGNNKAYKFQGTGETPSNGVEIDLSSLGVPDGKQIKSVSIYDIKDGQILGETGSPGYDLDALKIKGPCTLQNKATFAADNLDAPITASNTLDLDCKSRYKW